MTKFNMNGVEEVEAMELMLSRYTDWLNLWHEHYGDEEFEDESRDDKGKPVRMTRADYDDCPGDEAKVLNQICTNLATTMLTVYCSPYHDEGGPTILTGWFHKYNCGKNEHEWDLRTVLQSFDADEQLIYTKGNLVNTP